ncbi:YqjF family protein [Granulicella arctica]|uniref:YqjF family protein n=1 Tax=Granulicella arctica TaxID=940613 RepID=UPI0021E02AF4|nr:DUF2071 domain-containing protein [Granulicella arctica]
MPDILSTLAHRPYPLPSGQWRLAQRWNNLLFAHWPIPVAQLAPHLPVSLEPDTFDGHAWIGVVPFYMDRVRTRAMGDLAFTTPGTSSFPELNLRTYVRSRTTGLPGVYFFSLDAASLLAVIGARTLFHLPYFWAKMHSKPREDGTVLYESTRELTRKPARFKAEYKGSGIVTPSLPGTLASFLTERYCLFTTSGSRTLVGHIHHLPWPLEAAEAEISVNTLPTAHDITLPDCPPILHFARKLEVYIWSLRPDAAPAP